MELDGAITDLDLAAGNSNNLLLSVATSKGDISIWTTLPRDRADGAPRFDCGSLGKLDGMNIFESPHGIEVPAEDLLVYKEKQRHNVRARVMRDDPGVCVCCCDSLQYLYIRDLSGHQIVKRVVIDAFPLSLALLPAHNWVAVGATDGTVKMKNVESLEEQNVRIGAAPVLAVAAAENGEYVVAGTKGEMVKWGLELN